MILDFNMHCNCRYQRDLKSEINKVSKAYFVSAQFHRFSVSIIIIDETTLINFTSVGRN